MTDTALVSLTNEIAKKFIQRTDVKALQRPDGSYVPWEVDEAGRYRSSHKGGVREPWRRADLIAHVTGEKSFGHYLLDASGKCKLFAFDIDLEKVGWLPTEPLVITDEADYEVWANSFVQCNPREAWRDRRHPARSFMKGQLRTIAHRLMSEITAMGLQTACAYSGSKGLHVYAFTGPIDASDAFDGAMIVLDEVGCFEPKRGNVFFQHKDQSPVDGFPNLSIEVFPKQRSMEGKDLGNLMRLPLGRNAKSPNDPTFFLDMASGAMVDFVPLDPLYALTAASPWRKPSEVA